MASLVRLILQVRQEEWDAQRPIVKDIALRRYRWERIARKYAEVFREMDPRSRLRPPALRKD